MFVAYSGLLVKLRIETFFLQVNKASESFLKLKKKTIVLKGRVSWFSTCLYYLLACVEFLAIGPVFHCL